MSRQAGGPLVSVVIPTRNRPDSLDRTLASVAGQDWPDLEILVVDDGSDPPAVVEPPARLLRHARSQGAAAAKNRGLEAARGAYVLLLDDDIELVGGDVIGRAVARLEQHPSCALLAFRQLDPAGVPRWWQPAPGDRPCRVGRFATYACLARRAPLVELGGFEALFGYYYEEDDLAVRLLDAGWEILYDPALAVVHHHDDRGRDWQRIYRLGLRNSGYSAILRYPAWCVPLVLPRYVGVYLTNSRPLGTRRAVGNLLRTLGEWAAALPGLLRRRRPARYATLRRLKGLKRAPEVLDPEDGAVTPAGQPVALDSPGEP